MNTTERDVKEAILVRLHEQVGICGHCGKRICSQRGNSELPNTLALQDVLGAIDLDGLSSANKETNS